MTDNEAKAMTSAERSTGVRIVRDSDSERTIYKYNWYLYQWERVGSIRKAKPSVWHLFGNDDEKLVLFEGKLGDVVKKAKILFGRKTPKRWSQLAGRSDVLFLDIETAGFDSNAEIVEVAVVDGCGAERFHQLLLPTVDIQSGATAKHGMTKELLARSGAKSWSGIREELAELLSMAECVVVYNSRFAMEALRLTDHLHSLEESSRWNESITWICAMEAYSRVRGEGWWRDSYLEEGTQYFRYKHHKFANAIADLRVEKPSSPRAMPECRALAALAAAVSRKYGDADFYQDNPNKRTAASRGGYGTPAASSGGGCLTILAFAVVAAIVLAILLA